jgi:microcystin-dependent protein
MTEDDYMGSVSVTAGFYAPVNTALCQGQTLSIAQNDALFSLLQVNYGGNGQTTFALPNLAGAVPFGTGNQPGTTTDWIIGQTQSPLTAQVWPGGNPAAVAPGGTATLPITTGISGIALNWALTLVGIFPSRP